MVKYQKKKVLHIANKNALHGGIGTVLDYLHNGVNESEDFQSDTLLTSYDHKNKRPRLSTLKKDDSNKNVKHADLDSLVEDYDVVHVHGIPHYGILEKLYEAKSKNPGLKVVNTAHSSVKSEFEAQLENAKKSPHKKEEARSLQYLKDRNVLNDPSKFADTYWGSAIWRQEQIMTISDSVQHMNEAYKAQILDEYSAEESAQKHTVVPNGVHKIKETVAKPNKKRLLFVGRFGKEKGVDEFVDALPHIFEENPDAEVRFVGGDKSGKVVEIYKKKVAAKLRKHFKNKTGHNVIIISVVLNLLVGLQTKINWQNIINGQII